MSSHDLLNYSIMHNNSSRTNHYSHHQPYYHQTSNIVSLPPLTPILKQFSSDAHSHHEQSSSIVLPPLTRLPSSSNLNYITSSNHRMVSSSSNSSTGTTTPTNSNKLTEHNLLHLSDSFNKQSPTTTNSTLSNSTQNHHGLGLLSSAISSLQDHHQIHNHRHNNIKQQIEEPKTNPPSLTSASSVASLSPVSSPSISSAIFTDSAVASKVSKPQTTTDNNSGSTNKRRQRLGPSCDSCRLRKVKCNAEIVILAKSIEEINQNQLIYQYNLSAAELGNLLNQHEVVKKVDQLDNNEEINLLISNQKLIKYKFCNSCNSKGLNCCFSKGFTKEDIMLNNKKPIPSESTATVTTTTTATVAPSPVATMVAPVSSPVIKKEKPIKIAKKVQSTTPIVNTKTISSLTAALTKSLTEGPTMIVPSTNVISKVSIINYLETPASNIEEKHVLIPASTAPSTILTDTNSSNNNNNNATRKSSCISCRKRKVKCVYSSVLNKCEGCYKKNHECKFDVNTVKPLLN